MPRGFESALGNPQKAELAAQLWSDLLKMERDESPKVRGEVEETLLRLNSHGSQGDDDCLL